jgi:hypothetical protein
MRIRLRARFVVANRDPLPPRTFSMRAVAVVACAERPSIPSVLPVQVSSPSGNGSAASFAIASDFSAAAAVPSANTADAAASVRMVNIVRFMAVPLCES